MALRKILTEPDKILRKKSLKVNQVDEDLQKLMDDMLETMYAAPGIGLAAIQVGVPKRVIILDVGWRDKSESTNDDFSLRILFGSIKICLKAMQICINYKTIIVK